MPHCVRSFLSARSFCSAELCSARLHLTSRIARFTMARRWEQDIHAWEQDAFGEYPEESGSETEVNYDEILAEEAGEELASMIVDLKLQGILSAKQACVLSFFASRAGASGFVGALAMKPSAHSGSFSRHFDMVLGVRPQEGEEFYSMPVPGFKRTEAARVTFQLPCWPPHEAIDEEQRSTPDMPRKLAQAIADGELPPSYAAHNVVTSAPAGIPVYPLALYIDAVNFTRTDAVVGFWVCSLVTGGRHLVSVLRKTEMCQCGCRGWDTIFQVMAMLNWSFQVMARGVLPSERHDGEGWRETDAARAAVQGVELGWRGAVLFVKNDMMEFVTSFGFPSWASVNHPCALCHCTRGNWNTIAGVSALGLPWAPKTYADYDAACAACEVWVEIADERMFRHVRASLDFDKRKDGARGRALTVAIPELGLKKGDRIEPHAGLCNVADFDSLVLPKRVLFWRRSCESMTRRRNPLVSPETGILPSSCFVVDSLHALSLGAYKMYLSLLFHRLFAVDAFKVRSDVAHVRIHASVARLRSLLFEWYRAEEEQGREHTQVQSLTTEMVGTSEEHMLGTWGHETNAILEFSPLLLRQFGGALPEGEYILLERGGQSLLKTHEIIKCYRGGACPAYIAQDRRRTNV